MVQALKEVKVYGWLGQVGRSLPVVVLDSKTNSSLRLILVDSLPSMWKIGGKIWRTKMSDVVSALEMLINIQEIRGGKRTVLRDRGATGGSGTSSTGSTFNFLCGWNESLTSCKKASASNTCSGSVSVMGGGAW